MPTDATPWPDGDDDPGLPAWMHADDRWEDDDVPAPGPGRGRLLAVLAAVPWLVALVVLLRSGGGPDVPSAALAVADAASPTATAAGSESPNDALSSEQPRAAATPRERSAPSAPGHSRGDLPDGPRTSVTAADAVAMATAVARAWLTGVGPTLTVEGVPSPGPLYAEHLVVEAIDHPAPGFAVVTLLGVVLDAVDGAYEDATVRRLAVPVALDASGAHPAGAPWWLPAPDLSPTTVDTRPLDDPELALQAATAATVAGYTAVELLELHRTDAWPLIATLRAIAPGRSEVEEHRVWLRVHLDGLVIAGWLPERTEPTPTEDRP